MNHLARDLVNSSRPLVIAHRGDSRRAPENTLPAFLSAVRAGADLIELDYRHSLDGVPVVFHDETLDRRTNARQIWPDEPPSISISDKPLSELRRLDAGGWFAAEFAGTPLSTLTEALDAVMPHACLAVERKMGDAATLVATLAAHAGRQRVVLMAFDWQFLSEVHEQSPDIPLVALGDDPLTVEKLDAAQAAGASVIGWIDKQLDIDGIRRIHGRNLKAWCWTVDDPVRARELFDAGLDGLITNLPAEMLAVRDSTPPG